ncbi:MAG: hypothetical protein IPF95_02730 [Flavobacteriales bacterium]|nr:hypothetical protein [Flavobacteriales bacterium]MBK6944641.1 hypothetical protein [Flavobacteriales bacterium]MBK7295630.1 hypothetical protein [Flavobacteriales bacterium]MBK9534295.1 hypothetical protein [Flavobacteriales bacterium]MBP9137282.1 hypothetical protein [Flavobacteriales bacterium]
MRPVNLVALFLMLAFCSCTSEQEPGVALSTLEQPALKASSAGFNPDILNFNIAQRTCALFVAVRSHAWAGEIPFGNEIDDSNLHWNLCPGGTMVACVKTPTVDGDTVITGIPWPYAEGARH